MYSSFPIWGSRHFLTKFRVIKEKTGYWNSLDEPSIPLAYYKLFHLSDHSDYSLDSLNQLVGLKFWTVLDAIGWRYCHSASPQKRNIWDDICTAIKMAAALKSCVWFLWQLTWWISDMTFLAALQLEHYIWEVCASIFSDETGLYVMDICVDQINHYIVCILC